MPNMSTVCFSNQRSIAFFHHTCRINESIWNVSREYVCQYYSSRKAQVLSQQALVVDRMQIKQPQITSMHIPCVSAPYKHPQREFQ